MEWSLYSRELEDEIVPLCAELGIEIVAYLPTGRGMLADTSLGISNMRFMDFRKMGKVGYASKNGERELAKALQELATSWDVSLATLSLAWLQKRVVMRLVGQVSYPYQALETLLAWKRMLRLFRYLTC